MERRYPHYLKRAGPGHWPRRIITADCVGRVVKTRKRGDVQTEALVSWFAIELIRETGCYQYRSEIAGRTAAEWWRMIDRSLAEGGITWVVCQDATRCWSLLGLWDLIEGDQIHIGKRPKTADRARSFAANILRYKGQPAETPIASGFITALMNADHAVLVAEGVPSILRCRRRDLPGELVWIDVRNHGADLADGLPHGPTVAATLAHWTLNYTAALEKHGLGAIQATAGSQALHGWRYGYHHSGLFAHNHTAALDLEGACYYGGRAEAYRIGSYSGNVYNLDIRSAYPWVCMEYDLPVRLAQYHSYPQAVRRFVEVHPLCCAARVAIRTDCPCVPKRQGTETIYPVGRFVTSLAGPELKMALDRGLVHRVYWLAEYEMGRPLHDYMEAVYVMRCGAEAQDNKMLGQSAKALLTCLPGKFGQRMKVWVTVPGMSWDHPYDVWWGTDQQGRPCRYRALAGMVQREEVLGWAPHAVPALAAWITSYVRVRLLELIEIAGWVNVLYVDTDSLILTEEGYGRIGVSPASAFTKAGSITLRASASRACVRGIKDYDLGNASVCAGRPRRTDSHTGSVPADRRTRSVAEWVRSGRRPEAESLECRPERTGGYHHGSVAADGTVTPFYLEEW